MSTHSKHETTDAFYFVTFTCHRWLPLLEKTCIHTYFPEWISQLDKRGISLCGYVLMPNHLHLVVFVHDSSKGLNSVIGEGKRFMAYEVVKRLKELKEVGLLKLLTEGVQLEEAKKGKKHQVFRLSFDAQELTKREDIERVLDYMHHNPVSGKWHLVDDFLAYPYSSARFYELGEEGIVPVKHYLDMTPSESSPPKTRPKE